MENDHDSKPKRTRKGKDESAYYGSECWQMLQRKDDLRYRTSTLGPKFTVRFRVPFVFLEHMKVKDTMAQGESARQKYFC